MQPTAHFVHLGMRAEVIYQRNLRFLMAVGSPSINTEAQNLE